jgi:hypothetical protein
VADVGRECCAGVGHCDDCCGDADEMIDKTFRVIAIVFWIAIVCTIAAALLAMWGA